MHPIKVETQQKVCTLCRSNLTPIDSWQQIANTAINQYIFEVCESYCPNCGLIQQSPAPDQDFWNKYYREKSVHHSQTLDYNLQNRVAYLKKNLPIGSALFEIGSNEGSFLAAARDAGFQVYGEDLCVEDNLVPTRQVDCVIMNHVLEHIGEPVEFLKRIRDSLTANGTLIIEVPNTYLVERFHSSIFHEHLYHFTPETLELVLIASGFDEVEFEYELVSRAVGFIAKASIRHTLGNTQEHLEALIKRNHQYCFSSLSLFRSALKIVLERQERYQKLINQLEVEKSSEVVLWGVNNICHDLFSKMSFELRRKCILVDASKEKQAGVLIDNIQQKVVAPSDLAELGLSNNSLAIICAISWKSEITEKLLELGIPKQNSLIAPY